MVVSIELVAGVDGGKLLINQLRISQSLEIIRMSHPLQSNYCRHCLLNHSFFT